MKKVTVFVSIIILSFKAISGSNWTSLVDVFTSDISGKVSNGSVFVMPIVDSSSNDIYLPFTEQLRTVLMSSLESNNISITTNLLDYQFLLKSSFKKSKEGLFLNAEIIDKNGNKVLNKFLNLKGSDLPTYWKQRRIKDIAYEIAGKIDKEIPAQRFIWRRY